MKNFFQRFIDICRAMTRVGGQVTKVVVGTSTLTPGGCSRASVAEGDGREVIKQISQRQTTKDIR